MSLQRLKSYLETVPRHVGIHFGGFSEAWLNPECTDLLLYVHETGYRITVHTTLAGLSANDVLRMAHVPFRLFRVHLPDSRMRLELNQAYLDTLIALRVSRTQNLDYVRLLTADEDTGVLDPRIEDALADATVFVDYLSDRAGNIEGLGIQTTVRKTGRIRCSFDPSTNRLDHNILLPNGDLILCCSDWSLSCVIGNLGTQSYGKILEQSPTLAEIRQGLDDDSKDTICRRCALAVSIDD
jgi:hypothetical protein